MWKSPLGKFCVIIVSICVILYICGRLGVFGGDLRKALMPETISSESSDRSEFEKIVIDNCDLTTLPRVPQDPVFLTQKDNNANNGQETISTPQGIENSTPIVIPAVVSGGKITVDAFTESRAIDSARVKAKGNLLNKYDDENQRSMVLRYMHPTVDTVYRNRRGTFSAEVEYSFDEKYLTPNQ